jgi:hypothetical protein
MAFIAGFVRRYRRESPLPPNGAIPTNRVSPSVPRQPTSYGLGNRAPPGLPLPAKRATSLLTRGEQAFYYPLMMALRGEYHVSCKVRLADVAPYDGYPAGEARWFKRIKGYHIDFVICDAYSMAPLLAIELDDARHNEATQVERDKFKNEVLRAAGLAICRIRAQQAYDPAELGETIRRKIADTRR